MLDMIQVYDSVHMASLPKVSDKETKRTSIQRARRAIDAERLIERLNQHVFGRRKLESSQYNSIKLMLGKVMPDLQALEYRGEVDLNVIKGKPISSSEWTKKHVIDGQAQHVSSPKQELAQAPAQAQELLQGATQSDPIARAASMAQEQGPPWRIRDK